MNGARWSADMAATPADLDEAGVEFPTASGTHQSVTLRHALTFRSARKWYLGSGFALAWLLLIGYEYIQSTPRPTATFAAIALTLLLAYAIAFAVAIPVMWWLPLRGRMWVIVGLWALSFALWPFWGWDLSQLWAFVGVVIGMSMFTMRISYLLIALLTTCAVLFQFMDGARGQALVWSPAIIASVSVMMTALSRQVAVVNQLRATQHELARLAVEKERSRVARDIHDILGHSLTAITVKTEAVGRLIPIDPAHAVAENAEVEKLARGALADVRSAVTAFRTMSVLTELAHARSILASAGIAAELPPTTEALPSLWRELGGWIVREGVTNVIRHSQATRCRILFNADFIEVADDGHGAVEPSRWEELGNGLRGLRERAEAAGLSMTVGRSADLGGFLLRVRTATAGVSSARPRTDAVNNGRSEY